MNETLQTTPAGSNILRRLRPPTSRNAYLMFPFARESYINGGYTLVLQPGEPAVAPGDGTVSSIRQSFASWSHSPGDLDSFSPYEVSIDHGEGLVSVISGFNEVSVAGGTRVRRGDRLGTLETDECFYGLKVAGKFVNPNNINPTFKVQNGNWVTGQGHKLRFAPDRLVRDLSAGVTSLIDAGLRFFSPQTFLLNVDFNGNGSKTGAAVVGASGDRWNVYVPVEFTATEEPECYLEYIGSGETFSSAPVQALILSTGRRSSVLLEKVSPLEATAGSAASFDAMLGTYAGGLDGFSVGITNEFRFRNVPAGTFDIYVYCYGQTGDDATSVYLWLDAGVPVLEETSPVGAVSTFTDGVNYVVFNNVVLTGAETMSIRTVGYLSGVQIRRL